MHLAVKAHILKHVAAVGLERAPIVVEPYTRNPRDQPVGDDGRETAMERVPAAHAPAAHHIEALVELLEQAWDVARVVLEIPVDRHDDIPSGVVDAGGERGSLTDVPAEADHPEPGIEGCYAREAVERRVGRYVVHEDVLREDEGR